MNKTYDYDEVRMFAYEGAWHPYNRINEPHYG